MSPAGGATCTSLVVPSRPAGLLLTFPSKPPTLVLGRLSDVRQNGVPVVSRPASFLARILAAAATLRNFLAPLMCRGGTSFGHFLAGSLRC